MFNRTIEKAQSLAEEFQGICLSSLDINSEVPIRAIISTVPGTSRFTVDQSLLNREPRPIVVDVAYRPRLTAILETVCLLIF